MIDRIVSEEEYCDLVFKGVAVPESKIVEAVFECCRFEGCDFSGVDFTGCEFLDCVFVKCNLSVIKVVDVKCVNTEFVDCKMIGIDWTCSAWGNMTLSSTVTFARCLMHDASFFGLTLKGFVMRDCKAIDIDFREANFISAVFNGSDFKGSLFNNTQLAKASFVQCINYNIDIYENNIKGAIFSRIEAISLLAGLDIKLVD